MQKIRDVNIEDLLGREPVHLDIEEIGSYLKDRVVMVTGEEAQSVRSCAGR